MSPFSLYGLFSLDTLDTRFTTSSRAPFGSNNIQNGDIRLASLKEDHERTRTGDVPAGASRPRWQTLEFYFYYLCFFICVPLMFKAGYDVSKPSHPNYKNFEDLLSPGWIPGRKVDNSDAQYSNFRNNLPYLFLLVLGHPVLRRVYNAFTSAPEAPLANGHAAKHSQRHSTAATSRLDSRARFDVGFALIFLSVLHGFSVLKIIILVCLNYLIAARLPRIYVVPLTWLFNVTILFANEMCNGYSYTSIANVTLPFTVWDPNSNWGTFCDEHSGLIPRWEIFFNITVLRLISFNMDLYWSADREGGVSLLELDPANLSERDRITMPAAREDYNFRNYLAYTFYAPLYLAGPILTFNEYISQCRYPPASIQPRRTLLYAIRFGLCLLTMELMLHFIYAVAISKAHPVWEIYSPFQISMLGYFNLHLIWLKLLLPWRFFRMWALADGVDPPENMVRCMSNNYSVMAFWRSWHRSYNRWVTRYIYIPLGGSGVPPSSSSPISSAPKISTQNLRPPRDYWPMARTAFNYLVVFTFVALWHDIKLNLLMWGWLVVLFFLPQMVATWLFPVKKWQRERPEAFRVICGIGGVGNILMLMTANLVGFALGLEGLQGMLNGILGSFSGFAYLLTACAALFVGVQVMFETREEELRHGIRMKC